MIEKIARSRTNGVMQSTLNQIDLTKISSNGLPTSSSIDDFEDSGIKKSKSHVQYLIDPMVKIGLIAKQPYSYRIGIGSNFAPPIEPKIWVKIQK